MQELLSVVIPRRLQERFEAAWKGSRIILFTAPCGCGKTTSAQKLLSKFSVCRRSAEQNDFLNEPIPEGCEVFLLDQLQYLKDSEQQQELCECIRQSPGLHFVLLTRGRTPGWLMPFQFAGMMETIEMEHLLFDRAAVQELLAAHGVTQLTDTELTDIWRESLGHPATLAACCRRLESGAVLDTALLGAIRREMYAYFDEMVYRRLDGRLRRFVLSLAPFAQFGPDIARMVSGDSMAVEWMEQLWQDTSMLVSEGADTFRFQPFWREFLQWELERELTQAEQKTLYSRAGLHYELTGALRLALEAYTQAGEHDKVSALLIKNAELHPGAAQYYDLEQYYFALPEETILRSPVLIAGMSLLCSMCMEYEQSEGWYRALERYAAGLKKSDTEYKLARGRIAYLDIALPHRGTAGFLELFPSLLRLITDKSIERQSLSVTSMLPSVMNGGKDFCEWSLKDDFLYATFRGVLEAVLGTEGVGLADCAICESKLEKDEDYQPRLLTVMARLTEIQRHGVPDMEYVAVALLARAQLAQGKAQVALDTILSLREKFTEQNHARFFPNMDAMLCRIYLYLGDMEQVDHWYLNDAPKEDYRLWVLWRFRYITKALVQLARGDSSGALLVSRLLPYTDVCARVMDALHIRIIMAICYFRQGNKQWKIELQTALDSAFHYRFIRPVAEYGAAVLPLLTGCDWQEDADYWKRLLAATRIMAASYPDYLQPFPGLRSPLTATEALVCRLLCNNKSNRDICEILGIALPTAKTHVASVLDKLGVSRRTEVKDAAERLHLL